MVVVGKEPFAADQVGRGAVVCAYVALGDEKARLATRNAVGGIALFANLDESVAAHQHSGRNCEVVEVDRSVAVTAEPLS